MLEVFMLPAGKGDFFIIKYGSEGDEHYIFIDGGDKAGILVYKKALSVMLQTKKTIDAMIFTHIDDDHICGALSAMKAMRELPEISNIFVNTGFGIERRLGLSIPGEYPEQMEREYLKEDSCRHTVARALSLIEFFKKRGLEEKLERCTCMGDELQIGGASLKIISPGKEQLEAYLRKWKDEERKNVVNKQHCGKVMPKKKPLSYYAAKEVKEDQSVINGSSIAFILNYEKKRLAFLGDAHPAVCAKGISIFYPNGSDMDLVKVSHHGSAHNYSEKLYELLRTDCFLLSTCGTVHQPDPILLAKLLNRYEQSRIFCNGDWMRGYGLTEEDFVEYCEGEQARICVLKEEREIHEIRLSGCFLG